MVPPEDALLAIEWTGTEPIAYLIKAIENGVANWQACTDCALTDCVPSLEARQLLTLKPGVNWISVQLTGQHRSVRLGMLSQLQPR